MSNIINLSFHGAARTVTGSCMEFAFNGKRILVDCGLFQGSRSLEVMNYEDFDFNPHDIDAVILTHAHIDHSGLLPKLVANGYKGDIYCTGPTRDLLQFMLADAGRIQEYEAMRRNRRKDRAGQSKFEPIYTEQDAIKAWEASIGIDYQTWFSPIDGFKARFWNAGHILGSASVELEIGEVKIICSGDIGPENKAFYEDPEAPQNLDYVICESTYGNRSRVHMQIEQRRNLLETEIKSALRRGGNLVVPVFALERTQELLLDIATLIVQGKIPNIPVFVDSPLASQATQVFKKHSSELEDLSDPNIFSHPAIHYVDDVEVSKRLNNVTGAIILSASGMCEAGRIRHHLIHNLPSANSTILFVGFQAQGSLGRTILDGAKMVRISGQEVSVKAQIRQIDSYSAHADQSELIEWIKGRLPINGSLILSHGEAQSIDYLAELIQKDEKTLSIIKPEIGETYELTKNNNARRLKTGRLDVRYAIDKDWQNEYADFSLNLKNDLKRIKDPEQRKKAIEHMRNIIESFVGKSQN